LTEILGQKEAVKLLQQTLDEEKETDAKLTKLALSKMRPTSTPSAAQ
jgi:ferritin-like metal-binding protein YciE